MLVKVSVFSIFLIKQNMSFSLRLKIKTWRINNTVGEVIGEAVNRQNMHTCDDNCDDICDDVYDVNTYFCYIMLLYLKYI